MVPKIDFVYFLFQAGDFSFYNVKLIKILKTSRILKVENAPKGSQLKLLAHMTNDISAIIKPKW